MDDWVEVGVFGEAEESRAPGEPLYLGRTLLAGGASEPFVGDIDEVRQKIEWGYRFMNVGSPLGYGIQALNQHLATLR